MSTAGPCKEQLAIEEERISEKYAQEEAEAQGNLSNNAVVNSFGDCSKWIATALFLQDFSSPGSREFEEKK